MAPPPKVNYDDDYDESADEDYNPTSNARQVDHEVEHSESEQDEDVQASGDEVVARGSSNKKASSKSRKNHAKHESSTTAMEVEKSSVKTRSQRGIGTERRRDKAVTAKASKPTADIDAIFAQMTGETTRTPKPALEGVVASRDLQASPASLRQATQPMNACAETLPTTTSLTDSHKPGAKIQRAEDGNGSVRASEPTESTAEDKTFNGLVRIRRKYEFAGEVMEEEKLVPVDSAEARLWREEEERRKKEPSTASGVVQSAGNKNTSLKRPAKRKAAFGDPEDSILLATTAKVKGTKLNTVQKSKLDWAAHVDREGISDELDDHSRAKEGYLSRMDFLGRMDAKRDESLPSKK